MPQVFVRCPLDEFELGYERRHQPTTVFHLRGRQAFAPASTSSLRQVCKWELADLKSAETARKRFPHCRREAAPGAPGIKQPPPFEVTEDQRVERATALRVAAADEILCLIHAHLSPRPGALTGLILAGAALRNQAFESLYADGLNQFVERAR